MIEADEAHEASKDHLNHIKLAHAAEDGEGSPTSPTKGQGHFWANMEKKKVHLPRFIGFTATFECFAGVETHVEVMNLDDDAGGW